MAGGFQARTQYYKNVVIVTCVMLEFELCDWLNMVTQLKTANKNA